MEILRQMFILRGHYRLRQCSAEGHIKFLSYRSQYPLPDMNGKCYDKSQDRNNETIHKYVIGNIDVLKFPNQDDTLVINVP